MTLEESRVYETELFGIVVNGSVKSIPGFYKLTKSKNGENVFIIDPNATLEEVRKGASLIGRLDEKQNYSLVKDIGFVIFSSDSDVKDVTITHAPHKLIVFVPLVFSPGYVEKKLPRLIRSKKTVKEIVEVTRKLENLLESPQLKVGRTRVMNIEFEKVADIITFRIGRYEIMVMRSKTKPGELIVDVKSVKR